MNDKSRPIIIKKVIKKHEGHHGGSWKVAYADFVTALMAFFLLLWLLSMVSPEKRARLAEYFQSFSVFKESGTSFMQGSRQMLVKEGTEMAIQQKHSPMPQKITPENLQKKIRDAVESKMKSLENQVMIDIKDGEVRIQIVDTEGSLMFARGSSQPTEKAKALLKVLSENIKDLDNRIAIEGHTDSVPFRGEQITNWELSTARASAARRELESNGIDPAHIARVVGYSDKELLFKDDPTNSRNRRISIIIMGEMAESVAEKVASPQARPPATAMPESSAALRVPIVR